MMYPTNYDLSSWILLCQAIDDLVDYRARELAQYGITIRESEVLLAIQVSGSETTPSEISQQLHRSQHSIYSILNRMDEKELIRKTKDVRSRNNIRVSLTEKGKQAYEYSTRRESICRTMSVLSEEERIQLGLYFTILRRHLQSQVQTTY